MTNSLLQWHLARDNQLNLARFCEKHKTSSSTKPHTFNDGEHDFFQMTFQFDNGSFITAELLHGEANKSYTVADHFQVVDYAWGTC